MESTPAESSSGLLYPTPMVSATTTGRNLTQPTTTNNFFRFLQSTASNLSTFLATKTPSHTCLSQKVVYPISFSSTTLESPYPSLLYSCFDSTQPDSLSSKETRTSSSPAINGMSSMKGTGFPSTVKISGLKSANNGGGPAFVGQIFTMCDLSGISLMAVSTHYDIPFLSKRMPEWLKKMLAAVTKSERNDPLFRFFMDLGDAVSYVKKLNIPSGVVGACRLDLAYEHYKDKPHLFQFVPNKKQVKEANKLLKSMSKNGGKKKIEGVPVFSAHNLDIAIATTNGVKWYTPYFFDKNILDNILEESADQHFHGMIQIRNMRRRREVIDDDMAGELVEEMGDAMWEPPEVNEMLDEMGQPGIPLSVLSKEAEMELHYAVDKVLLGNRWLRKVTGIQPKFPYMVDSFEKRSAASFQRACSSSNLVSTSELGSDNMQQLQHLAPSEDKSTDGIYAEQGQNVDSRFASRDWLGLPWLKLGEKIPCLADKRGENVGVEAGKAAVQPSSPLLPKITMVGISTGESGRISKENLKKTMEDLTKELEDMNQPKNNSGYEGGKCEERDPLFVAANLGDHRNRFNSMAQERKAI